MSVSLKIQDLKVTSLILENNEVSWSIGETYDSVLDFDFQVLRSESPDGPFEPLHPGAFQDRYLFIDTALPPVHRWRNLFYKIRVTDRRSGEFEDFGPTTKEPEADLVALEIRRQLQLLFREHSGRRCWVLPVRTSGQRCTACWDNRLKKRTRSGCRTCFDTGFIRGYLSPIETFMEIDPSVKSEQNMNVGTTHQSNTTGKFGYYPSLKPRDLIVEPENRRWRVVKQTQTEHVRARIMQQFELHEIPPSDIEYSIPIRTEEAIKDMFLSASRNFTNPHNLEAAQDEDIPRILSLYTSTYSSPDK